MKKVLLLFFVALFMVPYSADAIYTAPDMWRAWGYNGETGTNGSAGNFVIAGSTKKNSVHGTWDDEWGVVGVVATKIVEHGGYFCPYQIQCANKWGKKASWTQYYFPNGYDSSKCAWLCESGYSGENCAPQAGTPVNCDMTVYNTSNDGKFSGISVKTSGKNDNQREGDITGFNQWGSDPECDVVLGVTKFLQHGVIAAPVRVCCGRDNWKKNDSFVDSVYAAPGKQKLLCAYGYKANSTGTDCEPVTEQCKLDNTVFCENFPRESFNSSIHTLVYADSGCAKYFCSEVGKAFAAAGEFSCEDCGVGVKAGGNPLNGVCVKCQTGEYFDQKSNSCKAAAAYSKSDMQYGKGQTKNTVAVEDQCWTLVEPQDYADCVRGIKKPKLVRSDLPLLQAVPAVTKLPTLSNYKLDQTTLQVTQ